MSPLKLSAAVGICLAPLAAFPQGPPRQPNAAELLRDIERLSVVGSVLYVAAHPDDENTRLLAYLANEKMLRAAYLSITRGEGGQNLIGPEQGPLLGLIRTQELLAARRIDGAEQFFTRARDFGYSKTSAETLAIWGRDEVLADIVWVIRTFRPDVIVTRFPPDGVDTHGHHTASAILTAEAFRAAADPKFHPEQLQHAAPWQTRRLVWNRFQFNAKPDENLSGFVKLDVGGYNALLGRSYGEIAAESRSMHKSQGFGATPSRGTALEYFQNLQGDPARESILDGIDLSWARVPGAQKLAQHLAKAKEQFRAESPQAALPALLDAYGELQQLPANPWKEQKTQQLVNAIAACAGLWAEAYASEHTTSAGSQLKVNAVALNRSSAPVQLVEIRFTGGGVVAVNKPLAPKEPIAIENTLTIPEGQCSNPYWLEQPPRKGTFTVTDQRLVGLPEQPAPLRAEFVVSAGQRTFVLARPIAFKWTDPVAGEKYRSMDIVAPVTITPSTSVMMFPDAGPKELRVLIKSGSDRGEGVLKPQLPEAWTSEPSSIPFKLEKKGTEKEVAFRIRPPQGKSVEGSTAVNGTLRLVAEVGGKSYSRALARIEHSHIPIQTLLPESAVKLVRFDLKRKKGHLGYIVGAGDEVPAALQQVGYQVTILDDEALKTRPLAQFEAIIVGVRAYNTNERMPFYYKRLMDYVAAGGTLIVQYNTNNRLSRMSAQIGPHPFEISQERVTDEDAPVTFDAPGHAVLQRPNRLTPSDFHGWVQERGLYFAGKWSDRYETVLSMSDPGEPPRKGSLLVTKYGKGAFIYTGLAFFRQLPAGVSGAYRLFANLIAYGK